MSNENLRKLGWTPFSERYPDKFPCSGINVDMQVMDIIKGMDEHNKAFRHAAFCQSMPGGMSMPFTHWKPLEDQK